MRVDLLQIVINLSESEIILRTFRSTLSCYSRYLENTWTDILEKKFRTQSMEIVWGSRMDFDPPQQLYCIKVNKDMVWKLD